MALTEFKLPDVGEGVTEGELVKWLVKAGDTLKVDQPIAEIMTDKATVEIPSPVTGTVKDLKANPGDRIPVGGVMLTIETGGAGTAPKAEAAKAPAAAPQKEMRAAPAKEPITVTKSSNGHGTHGTGLEVYPPAALSSVLATPATRRLAREMGVDINQIQGTGELGRVTQQDLVGHGGGSAPMTKQTKTPAIPPLKAPRYEGAVGETEERVKLIGIRRKIAEKMQQAKHIVPHFTIMDECNVTDLVEMREKLKAKAEKTGIKITYLPFVMKALIATLRDFPEANASIDDEAGEIVYKKYYNLGFAADTPQGLVVPVIKHADRKTITEISHEIMVLADKAKGGKLAPDDMKGGTISITNIGSVGGTYATPIINHPEVAILGMYKISEKPIIKNGELSSIKVMNLTLTADHRLIDGAVAARFLKALIERLENPGVLMLDLM